MNEHFLKLMMEKHQTDEAGVRQIMAERGRTGAANREAKLKAAGKKHKGGFSDPDFAREMGAKGKASRYAKN